MILYILIQGKGDRKRLRCTYRLSGRVRIISGVDHNHWNGWGGISSMDGSQSLELGVSITGIHSQPLGRQAVLERVNHLQYCPTARLSNEQIDRPLGG